MRRNEKESEELPRPTRAEAQATRLVLNWENHLEDITLCFIKWNSPRHKTKTKFKKKELKLVQERLYTTPTELSPTPPCLQAGEGEGTQHLGLLAVATGSDKALVMVERGLGRILSS